MNVNIEKVRKLLCVILIKKGIPIHDASIIAEEYLEGELQGKASHGLVAFFSLVKKFLFTTKRKLRIIKKTHAYLFVDARGELGFLAGRAVANMLVTMARKEGAAIGLIRQMVTWLRPGSIAQYIADKGFIALVLNTGGKAMVAPPGGYEPMVGTNPIGIGIPGRAESFVADMATSKRAWGEVRQAQALGKKLPNESFFDKKGNFTLNPFHAYSAIAAGDYKGFALGLLVEILGGSLVGMPMSISMQKAKRLPDYTSSLRGACILVINPRFSTALATFLSENSKLFTKIRKSKKRKGTKTILIPGDRARAMRQKNLTRGYVDIPEDLWKNIQTLL